MSSKLYADDRKKAIELEQRMIDKPEETSFEIIAKLAAAEKLASALRLIARNKLTEENCASVELAGRRAANIAREALAEWDKVQS